MDAQLEWSGQGELAQKKKPAREDLDAFETAYNAACASIARGEFAQGEICLKRAIDRCNEVEDMSTEEKEAEILPMKVQHVYILTQMGKTDEAEKLAATIPLTEYAFNKQLEKLALIKYRIKELSTRHIAQVNNIAAAKEHPNPYLSHRLFHSSRQPSKTDQFFSYQDNLLREDGYVMSLLSTKGKGVASSTEKVILAQPMPTLAPAVNMAAVINAAAHSRNAGSEKTALKLIIPLLEKRPNDVGLILTITHLYVLTGNPAAAAHLLENFFYRLEHSGSASDLDVRFAPGLVATLVSLYAQQGRSAASKVELAKAAEYWRNPHKSQTEAPSKALMVAAGTALLDTHNADNVATAGAIFKSLYDQDENDRAAIAGLVAAYSLSDPTNIPEDLRSYLPEASRLVADLDAAALEDAGVAALAAPVQSATKKRAAPKQVPSKAKRLRKARMPKEFDPNKKIDAERWLPMRDRSYYRPKGRKGKKKAEGFTQGGMVGEEKAAGAQQGGGGASAAKKKKGKGRK